MYERLRFRARAVLLTIGVLGLLPALAGAGQSMADDRVLRVQEGSSVRQYAVEELVAAIGLAELEVAKDPHFGPNRVFAGFALEPLLDHIGLGDAAELLLVCADGYRIPFDPSALSHSQLRGLLAIRDTTLPAQGDTHFEPFRHGSETISLDPFYLVWASADDRADLGTETLPWPFQLTEIHRFDRAAYFAPARPPATAGDAAREGFGIYTAHCGKCHRMRGVGGDVGPAIDREGSLSSVLNASQLRDYVRHEGRSYPRSKMPQFSKLLSATEIDQLVRYLRSMQPRR